MKTHKEIILVVLILSLMFLFSCKKSNNDILAPTNEPNFGSGTTSGGYGGYIRKVYNTNGTFSGYWSFQFSTPTFLNTGGTGKVEITSNGFSKKFDVKKDSTYQLTVYYFSGYSTVCPITIGNRTIAYSEGSCYSTVTNISFDRIGK